MKKECMWQTALAHCLLLCPVPLPQELHSGSCQHVQLLSGDSLRKHL